MSQLFGDRAIIANATGCSSIYGGNLPTTPYTTRKDGEAPPGRTRSSRTPRSSVSGSGSPPTSSKEYAAELVEREIVERNLGIDTGLLTNIRDNPPGEQAEIENQRQWVIDLKKALAKQRQSRSEGLPSVADDLIKRSVWIFGGDGWAYDIGFGGLDHVMASGRNVNVLVMDTEVYSNTGGQMSKATPTGAIAKFAAAGKTL